MEPFDPELFTVRQWQGMAITVISLAIMLAMWIDAGKPYKKRAKKS